MTKNRKIIIGAASAVAVLGIALAVVLGLPSENDVVDDSDKDIILFDKSAFDVYDITVRNQSGEYQLLGYDYSKYEESDTEDITVIYTMQGYEDSMLSKLMTDNLVSESKTVAALRVVDKSGKKYVDYGLDEPTAEVKVVYSDLSEKDMFFGNEAPDKSGTYCRIDGDKNVYLINSGSIDMFFVDKLQMFEKQLTSEINESEKITGVSISGTAFDKDIYISREKNTVINSPSYTMTSPYPSACDTSTVTNFGTAFFGISISDVAAAGVGSKEIAEYGLDKPYMDINIKTNENRNINILISEKDSNGSCYVMKSGGTIIYSADDDTFGFYDIDYRYFLESSIYNPNMSNVASMRISYQDNVYEYIFDKIESINDLHEYTYETTVYYEGQQIDYMNLSDFISNVSNIYRQDDIPQSIEGCKEIFRIDALFDDGSTYVLVLYQDSENKVIATINGNIESYVDEGYVNEVIKQTAKIPTDEDVEALENE